MANAKDQIAVLMEFERDTKRTYRFKEVAASLNGSKLNQEVIGVLYVQKHAFAKGQPKAITVTLALTEVQG